MEIPNNFKISVDTTEIDIAIEKAKELVTLLERADELLNNIRPYRRSTELPMNLCQQIQTVPNGNVGINEIRC